jgi:hypothetical protein
MCVSSALAEYGASLRVGATCKVGATCNASIESLGAAIVTKHDTCRNGIHS